MTDLHRFSLLIGLIGLLFLASCVSFSTASLYDGQAQEPVAPPPEEVRQAVEPTLFADDSSNVWGVLNDSCKQGSYSEDVVYSGKRAIHIAWDRINTNCEWIGFGIGWDDWAGKDLSEVQPVSAFSMQVRAGKGNMSGLPMVLTLEDYSTNQSYAYAGNKYFERTGIDENWQKVVIPLSAFDFDGDGLDPTNVKQLMFELQGIGDVYIDDIKMVKYTPEPEVSNKKEKRSMEAYLALPQVLFDDAFIRNQGWGFFEDDCQRIELSKEAYAGNSSIEVEWLSDDPAKCQPGAFGVSWSQWNPLDIRSIQKTAEVSFLVKNLGPASEKLALQVQLEELSGKRASVELMANYAKTETFGNDWTQVRIPLSEFSGIDMKTVHQLRFNSTGKAHFLIDKIQLESMNSDSGIR